MTIKLRPGTPADAEECGQIIFDAFSAISSQHNSPSDFPAVEVGIGVASMLLSHPGFYSVVAEDDGVVVGSNFLDERCSVAGLGPIIVSPTQQNSRVRRRLMQHMLDRAEERGYLGVRLLQAAYHSRSLALYAGMNFDVRDICSVIQRPQTWINAIDSASRFTVMTEVGKLAIQSSRGLALWWRTGTVSPATQPALGSSAILLGKVMTMLRR